MANYTNQVFYKSSTNMEELPDGSINLIVTSPPYFNIKDYSKDGHQDKSISDKKEEQMGDINNYHTFISKLVPIWKECYRVLVPNGKLIINTPLMPMIKNNLSTHYNRDIFNINSDIQNSILSNIADIYLLDVYIWDRANSTKDLMFGSYPYPSNFYAQNTSEFITVYAKGGKPAKVSQEIKDKSILTSQEWREYTKQIWTLNIPSKKDFAFGDHSAIMPETIARRCIRLFSFYGDTVLDPFTGSGTTLKVALEENRNYVGYEISEEYKSVIEEKIRCVEKNTWGEDLFNMLDIKRFKNKHYDKEDSEESVDIIDLFDNNYSL